jgi:RNA polymerase sigma-70 factor (ECF subfamily)
MGQTGVAYRTGQRHGDRDSRAAQNPPPVRDATSAPEAPLEPDAAAGPDVLLARDTTPVREVPPARVPDDAMSRERFNRLVLPHLDAAYNLARWLCGSDDRAADVSQESLLRAFQYRDGLRGESARAWLLTIVRNTFFTSLDEHKRQAVSHEEYVEESHAGWTEAAGALYQKPQTPEEALLASARRRSVDACLEALPVLYREIVVLRDLEELAYKDIARILDVPIGTVMSRLARGRRMLAGLLGNERRTQ